MGRWMWIIAVALSAFMPAVAVRAAGEAAKPGAAPIVPAPEFRTGYQMPRTVTSAAPSAWLDALDVLALAAAMGVGAYLVYARRSRRAVLALAVVSLLYFGFYRKGCICPIGSIQNVALAAGGSAPLTWNVALIFLLPLVFALFFGRVFCAGVCPLGAIQDVVVWKPVQVPAWLETGLGLFAWAYLGLGVLYAFVGSEFIICKYDPFVGFFRLSGPWHMIAIGTALLVGGLFVGRIYCRFICPYGVLLRLLSPFSKHKVTITPTDCVDCRLCEQACPFGAIRHPVPAASPRARAAARRQLVWAAGALPLVVALFAFAGWTGGEALSRTDRTVRLAQRVSLEERGLVEGVTDESKAFRGTGQPVAKLYERADRMRHRFAVGSGLLGAFLGLVLGAKGIGFALKRRRADYVADAGACVACARCYASCPVEVEVRVARHQKREEEALVTV